MPQSSLPERLRYAFDNSLSRGTIALIAWLSVFTFVFLFVSTFIVWIAGWVPEGTEAMSLPQTFWFGLMRTLDSGTMGGDEGSWPFKLSMLWVTLGGVFVVSTLIGVLNNGIEAQVDELRKGRSRVIERDHTVILNWSPHVFSLLSELSIANANKKDACVVILAEKDKVEMEDEIREHVPDLKTTRVVCRTGSSMELNDLDRVSVQTSRAIVVLAIEGSDDPDSDVIKTVLAITNGPNRRKEAYHIVAEIQNPANVEAAELVGRDELEIVLTGDLISRITVQTCRQSGLSIVYTELLDFDGDEIYFTEEPGLTGKTFGESLTMYEESCVMGLHTKDGKVLVNPPMDTKIQAGDQIIAISKDDDTIKLASGSPAIDESAIQSTEKSLPEPESTLILGWNWKGPRIITGLDAYVAPGSNVTVLANSEGIEEEIGALREDLRQQSLILVQGDCTQRRTLESMGIKGFNHIILLCSDTLEPQRADSRVLVTLLHLRDYAEKHKIDLSIVSEMLDVRNRTLAEITKADDFIVSDKLISLMMSQIAENKQLNAVFQDLFDPKGSEIYLKPATDYIKPGVAVNFYTIVEAARKRGEVAIGYRDLSKERDATAQYGVHVNPKKSEKVTFTAQDKIIILAED